MDIIRGGIEIVSTPAKWGLKIGSYVAGALTREHVTRLRQEEPVSRANQAIGGAKRGAKRGDSDLVVFEVLRAANAIEEIAKTDVVTASEIGPDLAKAALALPDGDLGARAAEQAIAKGLASTVNEIDKNVRYFPHQRKPTDEP